MCTNFHLFCVSFWCRTRLRQFSWYLWTDFWSPPPPTPRPYLRQVHCSLSAFLVGFHVHEKALLVPAVVSALLALDSTAGARMHLRLSFLAAFAVLPLLPGPELKLLKVRRGSVMRVLGTTDLRAVRCLALSSPPCESRLFFRCVLPPR